MGKISLPKDIFIADAGKSVKVTDFLLYTDFLLAVYQFMKSSKKNYSFLQMSLDLTLGQSNMVHLCVRGKRHLSHNSIQKICDVLEFKGVNKLYLETLHKYNVTRPIEERDRLLKRLLHIKDRSLSEGHDKEVLEYYSDWLHPVVRELACVPALKGEPAKIAQFITPSVTPEQVRKSINLLVKNKLLVAQKNCTFYLQSSDLLSSGEDVESHSLVSFHQQTLSLAKDAVTSFASNDREFGSLTMLVSEATIGILKKEVREFQNRIIDLVSKDIGQERVMQVNVHCFPLCRSIEKYDLREEELKEKAKIEFKKAAELTPPEK